MSGQPSPAYTILLIVFNRPQKTRALVDFLRVLPRAEIFVAADGWRHEGERARCEEVREIVAELAARHELHTRFSDRNLGCGLNVSSAIEWALEQRETVIIVEDDVQITTDFLDYCNANLARFGEDERVGCISGGPLVNLDQSTFRVPFLSRYPNIWGWATTRRAFAGFSLTLEGHDNRSIWSVLSRTFPSIAVRLYWFALLQLVRSGRIDTWDFQYYFLTWFKNARTLTPSRNLTQNIGFDAEATHVKRAPKNVGILDVKTEAGLPKIRDDEFPPLDDRYDRLIEKELYEISFYKVARFAVKYAISRPKVFK